MWDAAAVFSIHEQSMNHISLNKKAASLAISVCSAAIARMFAKSPTEALSAVRGHFPSADDLYNIYFYSCDCIDLNQVGPAVIYLTV